MTPVALVVPWSQRVLVIRLLGTLFVMIAVLLLYLAVRVVSPHRPLAAGIAAAILASMAGVVSMLSQVQNDALLLPLCVATFWLLARDLRSRRSGLLLPFVVGLSVVTQIVAGPAGVIAILVALRGDAALRAASWRSRAGARLIAVRGRGVRAPADSVDRLQRPGVPLALADVAGRERCGCAHHAEPRVVEALPGVPVLGRSRASSTASGCSSGPCRTGAPSPTAGPPA